MLGSAGFPGNDPPTRKLLLLMLPGLRLGGFEKQRSRPTRGGALGRPLPTGNLFAAANRFFDL